jgi:hypothetical protein
MKPVARGLLTREHYDKRAATIRAAGGQGIHLFNETRKAMLIGFGD